MTVSEKASYIKGLLDGMNISKEKDEGKLFSAIADLLEDLSLSVADLEDETSAMREYIDELDTDLSALESDVYDLDDEEEYDCEGCDEEECPIGLECPACGEMVYAEPCELESRDTLECPSCGQVLNIVCEELDDEEEEEEEEESSEN